MSQHRAPPAAATVAAMACDWWRDAGRDVDGMADTGNHVPRLLAIDETTQTRAPGPSARLHAEIMQTKATTWEMIEDDAPVSLAGIFPRRDESRRSHDREASIRP